MKASEIFKDKEERAAIKEIVDFFHGEITEVRDEDGVPVFVSEKRG